MRIVKLAFISVFFFSLLLLAISLLLPSSINISRAIDIHSTYDSVYRQVSDLRRWQRWYADYDSSATWVSGISSGKGARLIINKTTVTIQEANAYAIKAIWQFSDNTPLPGEFNFITHDSASLITVQWQFTQTVNWYPWQKFALIVSGRTIGPAMEKSLENLRNIVEAVH